MTRNEIRRRALRAAAAVSLSMGLVGCAGTVEVGASSSGGQGGGGGAEGGGQGGSTPSVTTTTATATTSTSSGDTPILTDAGVDPEEDAMASTGTGADAQVNCTEAADYATCCEEQGWSPEAGCMAWGPPMPPAMEVA